MTGKLTLELPTGKKIVVEDTFFWIVVTMRSPSAEGFLGKGAGTWETPRVFRVFLRDGSVLVRTLVFRCARYNGALTDSMWVSYLTLDSFPGFNRRRGAAPKYKQCIVGRP